MTALLAYVDILLRGVGLIGSCAALGGVVFAVAVLRPLARAHDALRRTLALICAGGLVVAVTQVASLALKLAALAGPDGAPTAIFLATDYARAAITRVLLAVCLAALAWRLRRAPDGREPWWGLIVVGALLAVGVAWLSHARGRLDHREVLMALDVVHKVAAAVWVGGLLHLLVSAPPLAGGGAPATAVLKRFSVLAVVAVTVLAASGLGLTLYYVDSVAGMVGTAYGVMVLSKMALLGGALVLGGLNFLAVRRLEPGASARVRWLVEAEVGIAVTVLLAAASLTSVPPTVDVVADRVTPDEVATRFMPRLPRVTSPSIDALLAVAAPISNADAVRQPEEYAWSEYNHHTAGLFVLAMGLLACLERTGRARWARHWPLLLVALAAFMFVRNDPEAWPVGPLGFWETLVLPEVLQHRLSTGLAAALGFFEWRVRTGRTRSARGPYVFPLLCAVAATLLLTHSHAIASLRTAFLTEVSHAPLGILGVLLAWGRWLELRLPVREACLPGGVWRGAMVAIGLLLVFYREG